MILFCGGLGDCVVGVVGEGMMFYENDERHSVENHFGFLMMTKSTRKSVAKLTMMVKGGEGIWLSQSLRISFSYLKKKQSINDEGGK